MGGLTSGRLVTIPVPRGKKSLPTMFYGDELGKSKDQRYGSPLKRKTFHYSENR
jgi:hypothetical protein